MKHLKTVLLYFIASSFLNATSQVAVNKDGSIPDTSAVFQVKGDNAGNPVEALFIESATGNVGIGTTTPGFPLTFKDIFGDKISLYGSSGNHYGFGIQYQLFEIFTDSTASDIAFGYGSSSNFTEVMRIKGSGQLAIGTSAPDTSAVMELSSTTRGWLPPRLSQSQMEAVSNPAAGTYIYNTDLKTLCIYNGAEWSCMDKQSVFDVQFVCGDPLLDYRDSASYNTVKIGTQCWMAESLNAGNRINVSQVQTDNGTIEKYCYNDIEDSCNVYGGLYQWNEMMSYKTTAGAQGICPVGWHIPTDNDWKTLEMALGMSQASVDSLDWRGTTEGGTLKETGNRYWDPPNTGATGSAGFVVLGAGFRVDASTYSYLHRRATIWSSSLLSGSPLIRRLDYNQSNIYRNTSYKSKGRSVRCLRD